MHVSITIVDVRPARNASVIGSYTTVTEGYFIIPPETEMSSPVTKLDASLTR